MSNKGDFEKERREFLRLLGIGEGAVLLSGIHLPMAIAKDMKSFWRKQN